MLIRTIVQTFRAWVSHIFSATLAFTEKLKAMEGVWTFYLIERPEPLNSEEIEQYKKLEKDFGGNVPADVIEHFFGGAIKKIVYHNIIPTVSRQQICKALSNNIAAVSEISVNYQELGTGTTTPANGDTGLQTPSGATRKAVSSRTYSSNQLNITAFWAATEATGTWREFASFMSGSLTSNSGVIFNHAAINVTVSAAQSLTIDGTVTIT